MPNIRYILLYTMVMLLMSSCFTGVESTPKITSSDVKKEHIQVTPEQQFLTEVTPQAPSQWRRGKRFYVTDTRIALALTSDAQIDTTALVGHDLLLKGITPQMSYMGEEMAVVEFIDGKGNTLSYKTQIPYTQIAEKQYLDIPYAVDRDIVDHVSTLTKGHTYYITTPLWYNPDNDKAVNGLRHIPVTIEDVVPGNANYPIKMVFKAADGDKHFAVFMTIGNRRTSTRNFDTLFAFDNPRTKYPNITDENWKLIVNSKVKLGMTKDECRLALGAPQVSGQRPTTAGMVEYWSYADGIYLLFEEGFLASFRH